MSAATNDVLVEYGKHRHNYDGLGHVLDVVRKNGTPHKPKHCVCLGCQHGTGHVSVAV